MSVKIDTKTKRIAMLGILTGFCLIIGYLERFIPLPITIPGFKLGLSNILILFAFYRLGKRDAFILLCGKVSLSALLFSGVSGFIYSAAGGLLAYLAMLFMLIIFKKEKRFSVISVSLIGGVFHNIGQLLAAYIMLGNKNVIYYFPVLFAFGVASGILNGIIACVMFIKKGRVIT